jgi:8-oxo-dGTP pyrophosphatase MutT (NUDIX family)
VTTDELADSSMTWPVVSSTDIYHGYVIGVRRDTLANDDGSTFTRDVVTHRGAVAIVAVDDAERVLTLTQYRHPPAQRMVELPAGLLDQEDEEPLEAAKRELAEEGHITATSWSPLLELILSPGTSDELITIYLATGVDDTGVPDGFVAGDEEATMTRRWVPMADLVEAILGGAVRNSVLVAGVLAAWVSRQRVNA